MSSCSQPSPLHVSEEFVEALALGRPISHELAEGLRHISRCPHCNESLEAERKVIELIRMAFADKAGRDDQPAQRPFLIQRTIKADGRS